MTATKTKASRKTRRSGGRQRLQQDRGDADEEAAERGAGQAAETADDGADEGDDDELQPHARLHDAGLRDDRQETAAARTPLSAKAMAITRLARTPSTRAMRKSSAAARICEAEAASPSGTRSGRRAGRR